jgi:hypothetical protein
MREYFVINQIQLIVIGILGVRYSVYLHKMLFQNLYERIDELRVCVGCCSIYYIDCDYHKSYNRLYK